MRGDGQNFDDLSLWEIADKLNGVQTVAPPPRGVAMRPYQDRAVSAAIESLERGVSSRLIVMPTGTGKTVVFSDYSRRRVEATGKRVLVVAHRDELIRQAANSIERVTGLRCGIEMAEERARSNCDVVVTSVQTQASGKRMNAFDPEHFCDVIIDEAHHAVAPTYRRLLAHYDREHIAVLGVTATPDRADEKGLAEVFTEVVFDYTLPDAIDDGWLAPIRQQLVRVTGLDLSGIRTVRGDLDPSELDRVLNDPEEQKLQAYIGPIWEIAAKRQGIVFATSVAHAHRMAGIFNRIKSDAAVVIDGGTDRNVRREIVRRFHAGDAQILCNCGIATEGFDAPGACWVAMCRPTKSRALYAQMVGRATRPLPGIVDGIEEAISRRAAIAMSAKPLCDVIDLVGNSGKHKLVSAIDLLGEKYSDEVVERARRKVDSGKERDPKKALEQEELARLERERRAREQRLRGVVGKSKYTVQAISPFDIFEVEPPRSNWRGRMATARQMEILAGSRIQPPSNGFSAAEASALIGEIFRRRTAGLATFAQVRTLRQFGVDGAEAMTFKEASEKLDELIGSRKKK